MGECDTTYGSGRRSVVKIGKEYDWAWFESSSIQGLGRSMLNNLAIGQKDAEQ